MTDSPVPLSPDVVDELLSAELDGEFDAAAADHDLDPAAARARLNATPGIDDRRTALAATRPALAVTPAADDARARMIATAAAAAAPTDELGTRRERRGRQARLVIGLSAAAAAVLLIVGLVATVSNNADDDSSVTAGAGAGEALTDEQEAGAPGIERDDGDDAAADVSDEAAPPLPATGAAGGIPFGSIPDLEWLRNRVGVELGYTAYSYPPQIFDEDTRSSLELAVPSADECVAKLATDFGLETEPVLRGVGIFQQTPVDVLVYQTDPDYTVLVVGADCAVLGSTAVGPEP